MSNVELFRALFDVSEDLFGTGRNISDGPKKLFSCIVNSKRILRSVLGKQMFPLPNVSYMSVTMENVVKKAIQ